MVLYDDALYLNCISYEPLIGKFGVKNFSFCVGINDFEELVVKLFAIKENKRTCNL